MHQQREETVQSIKREKSIQSGTLERADRAARIPEIRLQDRLARPASDFRRTPPHKIILSRQPHSAHEIDSLQLRQKARQVRRIILQITVQSRENGAGGILQAGPESRT